MRIFVLLLLLVLVVGCTNNMTGQVVTDVASDDAQVVLIGIDRMGGYVFTPSTIESGKETVLRNDGSLQGCAVAVVQEELGIRANFATQDEVVFTPTEPGTYTVACTMNMWRGELTVI